MLKYLDEPNFFFKTEMKDIWISFDTNDKTRLVNQGNFNNIIIDNPTSYIEFEAYPYLFPYELYKINIEKVLLIKFQSSIDTKIYFTYVNEKNSGRKSVPYDASLLEAIQKYNSMKNLDFYTDE